MDPTPASKADVNSREQKRLSVIVHVSRMAAQAERALHSLSPAYQRDANESDYEVLVVETPSCDLLGEARATAAGAHVRYIFLDDAAARRAQAIAFGVAQARAPFVGLLLDGSHVLTPRILCLALALTRLQGSWLAVVPEYRLTASDPDGGAEAERTLLERIRWTDNPYELFEVSRFGPANPNGFLGPLLGIACAFFPRKSLERAGGPDPAINGPGSAAMTLRLYTSLSALPDTRLLVLAGEGAFRQAHPEVLTDEVVRAESSVQHSLFAAVAPLGPEFRAVHREPTVLGAVPGQAQRFLKESSSIADYHCAACRARGEAAWYEDPPRTPRP